MNIQASEYAIFFFIELLATLLGVFTALHFERKHREKEQRERNDTSRLRLLEDIHGELERNAGHLEGKGHRMITDVWDSGVSSGLIQLLDSRKMRRLLKLYHAIKGQEYEARIARQAGEQFRSIPESEIDKSSTAYGRWSQLSEMGIKREANLKKRINKILNEEDVWK